MNKGWRKGERSIDSRETHSMIRKCSNEMTFVLQLQIFELNKLWIINYRKQLLHAIESLYMQKFDANGFE